MAKIAKPGRQVAVLGPQGTPVGTQSGTGSILDRRARRRGGSGSESGFCQILEFCRFRFCCFQDLGSNFGTLGHFRPQAAKMDLGPKWHFFANSGKSKNLGFSRKSRKNPVFGWRLGRQKVPKMTIFSQKNCIFGTFGAKCAKNPHFLVPIRK